MVDLVQIRHRLRWVCVGDPDRFDRPLRQGFEKFDRGFAGCRRELFNPPKTRHLGPIIGIGQFSVCAELVGQSADFTTAHGVGLARQTKGSGPGLADLPGRQMQIDQGGVFCGT